MADDGEVRIRTEIDNSGLEKGLKDAKKKVNDAAKDMSKGAKAANALKTALMKQVGLPVVLLPRWEVSQVLVAL